MAADQEPPSQSETIRVKPKKPFSFYMPVLALCLLAVITSWDATSLAIALPTITKDLNGTTTLQSFWANNAFILGVAVIQPIHVSVSDVVGRKLPLYVSMALFAIGSAVFASARHTVALIIGRAIQGLGGGGLDVLEEIILADITTLKQRPLYLCFIALAISTGSIAGPILGAVFSQFSSWRWIGWINLPIVGISFLLVLAFLRLRPVKTPWPVKIRRIDWTGIALFTIGATATASSISWAGALYPWSSWQTIVPLTIGVTVLIVFSFYEKRPDYAILPYRIFTNTTSVVSLVTGLLHGAILYTLLLYVPLFFQAVFLQTPLDAAQSTLPLAVLTVAFSVVAPVIIEITRCYRYLLLTGWAFTAVFLGVWSLIGYNFTSRAAAYTFQALMGIGVGTVFTGTQVPMQASVLHVDDTGLAVGMLVVFRLFGGLLGLAASSTAFSVVFDSNFDTLLGPPIPVEIQSLKDATQSIPFIPKLRELNLPPGTMDVVLQNYTRSFQAVWYILTAFSIVGFVVSLWLRDLTLEKEEVGRQGFDEMIVSNSDDP
ncbi:MFS general substrate transporter [Xylariaceae sp. FL1272]|nr:MFS general substrate transporter [Xylariaceae sp. FL1272]